jgi:hypothetical protein
VPVLFAQTSGTLKTNAGQFTTIPGLRLVMPKGLDVAALVVLNLPNPFAEGTDYPGALLGVALNGKPLPIIASFTYGVAQPASANRMPTTLVVSVPLSMNPQTVDGLWCGVRGSTVIIDTPSSLSVIY